MGSCTLKIEESHDRHHWKVASKTTNVEAQRGIHVFARETLELQIDDLKSGGDHPNYLRVVVDDHAGGDEDGPERATAEVEFHEVIASNGRETDGVPTWGVLQGAGAFITNAEFRGGDSLHDALARLVGAEETPLTSETQLLHTERLATSDFWIHDDHPVSYHVYTLR